MLVFKNVCVRVYTVFLLANRCAWQWFVFLFQYAVIIPTLRPLLRQWEEDKLKLCKLKQREEKHLNEMLINVIGFTKAHQRNCKCGHRHTFGCVKSRNWMCSFVT